MDVDTVPIEVQCYSGYKADESPRRFRHEDQWIEVEEVLDRWLQASKSRARSQADYFKIRADDDHLYLLRHDRTTDCWFLENKW